MREVHFVCVQPRLLYYAWQLEVMLMNFMENDVDPTRIHVVLAFSDDPNSQTNSPDTRDLFDRLRGRYTRVDFRDYPDRRPARSPYPSTIRPHLMARLLRDSPWLADAALFYHDCDIILTRRLDLSALAVDDTCYVSDTVAYIGASYVTSKGIELYRDMCAVVGIDPRVPIQRNRDSGGAQYLLKGTRPDFWDKVESDCHNMYALLTDRESSSPDPIQKWTTDMWCLLWNLWLSGQEVRVHPSLRFSWPSDPITMVDQASIFHNAGVTEPGGMFFKQDFTYRLPYGTNLELDPGLCSHYYYQQLRRYGADSCLR